MKNIFFCFCLGVGLLSACSSDKPRYTVKLDDIQKRQSMLASDLFKGVRVIPLETREDVLLGEVIRFQVADNKMFALGSRTGSGVYAFDMDGNYLYTIGQLGEGAGEFSSVEDFTIDPVKKIIYLLDEENILAYDLHTGTYQHDVAIQTSRGAKNIQFLDGRIFTDANTRADKPDLLYQLDLKTGEEINGSVDADTYNRGWIADYDFLGKGFFHSRNSDAPKYMQLFMNTVFSLEDGKAKPFLTVESKGWMNEEAVQEMKEFSLLNVRRYLAETYFYYTLYGWVENEKLIAFSIYNPYCRVLVDRATGAAIVMDRIIDNLVYTVSSDVHVQSFHAADESGFYTVHSIPQSLKARGWEMDEALVSNVENRDYLKELPDGVNPIVFYYQTR